MTRKIVSETWVQGDGRESRDNGSVMCWRVQGKGGVML